MQARLSSWQTVGAIQIIDVKYEQEIQSSQAKKILDIEGEMTMDNGTLGPSSLNDSQKLDFSEFEKVLTQWKGAYLYALLSYIGVKTSIETSLLFGRIILAPSRDGFPNTDFGFETDHIIAANSVMKTAPSDISSILEYAKAGEIHDISKGIILRLSKDGSFSTTFAPVHHPFFPEGPRRTPCILIRGISPYILLSRIPGQRHLDWELKAADLPFDNLDELLTHCGLPTQAQIRDFTALEIIATSPGFINDTSTIKAEVAMIDFRIAKALDTDKVKIGYKVFQKNSIERSSVVGHHLSLRQEGDFRIGTYQTPVKDAAVLQAFLSYKGVAFHHWWVVDPQKRLNYRYAIHQIVDEELDVLKRMLFKSKQEKSDNFEFAVSTLLSLLGFSTVNYGLRRKLMDGPDIIAITPMGNIGVIECTVGLPNHNSKLAKVAEKALLIGNKLVAAGFSSLQILPAVVTPLPRDAVAANRQDAAKHGIALICKEDIEELLNRIFLPPDADKQFNDAKQLIPILDQQHSF